MAKPDGIDVSTYQGKIDWAKVTASGVGFSFIRISRTVAHDTMAGANIAGARAAKLPIGGYHFLTNSASGTDQAKSFLAKAPLKPGDILPTIDIETPPSTPQARKKYVAACEDWIAAVSKKTGGKMPFIYTRKDVLTSLGNPVAFRACPLWLARYGSKPPAIPTGFSDFVIWQYSESGSVDGIKGAVDLDRLNLPLKDFLKNYTI
jgi:lysozyme